MAQTTSVVPKLYHCVIDDVVTNIREAFLDEGVDEQVLQELKQIWQNKLLHSKAVDFVSLEHDHVMNTQYSVEKQQQQHQQHQAQLQVQFQSQAHPPPTLQAQLQQPALVQPVYTAYDLSAPATAATMALPASIIQRHIAAVNSGTVVTSHQPGHTTTYYQAVPQTMGGTPTYVGVSQMGQQPQPTVVSGPGGSFIQLDGARDTSDEEESDNYGDDDNDQDNDDDRNDDENEFQGEEEEPLNSNDDVSDDDDASELFDTDNVVVCQYDKISRSRNKWKFHLKDGIMNLQGKDFVFQKAIGDAEW